MDKCRIVPRIECGVGALHNTVSNNNVVGNGIASGAPSTVGWYSEKTELKIHPRNEASNLSCKVTCTSKPILVIWLWVVVAVCVTLYHAFEHVYQCVIGGSHLFLSTLFATLMELRTAGGAMNQTCQRLGRRVDRVMGCQSEQSCIARTGTLEYASRLVTKLQEVRCYFRVIGVKKPGARKKRRRKKNPECEMHNIILFRIIILLVMVLLRGRPLPLDGVRKKPS